MQLLTKEDLKRLPPLGATENQADPIVQVKFFFPDFHWSWYATEYDGEDLFFGFVDGDFPELGYFRLSELKQHHGMLGLPIERDRFFQPCKLSEIRKKANARVGWGLIPPIAVGGDERHWPRKGGDRYECNLLYLPKGN